MASKNYKEKYTEPDLREELKEEIKQSDKGGKPGQWSARKSQLLVQEYEKKGGDYKKDKKDKAAKSLDQWSEQDWQTQDGDAEARQKKSTKRYLPKEVWDSLSEKDKKEAEQTKKKASKEGKQHVSWPSAVKEAMQKFDAKKKEQPSKEDLYAEAKALDIKGRSKMNKASLAKAIQKAKA